MNTNTNNSSTDTENIEQQLDTLTNQFNSVLSEFQQKYNDFIILINNENTSSSSTTNTADIYAIIPNANYWGQSGLSEGNSSSSAQCLADCYSKTGCTGATYDSDTNYCWVRTGNGRVAPGKDNQSAIIKKTILYKYQLEDLNARLIGINNKIMAIINDNTVIINTNTTLKNKQENALKYHKKMIEQNQMEIANLENQYKTLQVADQNSTLMVNQNYYWFVLYLIFVIILGIFLFVVVIKSGPKKAEQSAFGSITSNS